MKTNLKKREEKLLSLVAKVVVVVVLEDEHRKRGKEWNLHPMLCILTRANIKLQ
jgi:hypothetical protein